MTTATLDLFKLLVDAGVDAKKAEPLAKETLTRTEAKEVLVTKVDLGSEFRNHTRWLVGVFIGIAFGQLAIVTALFNFYLSAGF